MLNIILCFGQVESKNIKLNFSSKLEEKMLCAWINDHKFNTDTLSSWLISQENIHADEINNIKGSYFLLLDRIHSQIDVNDDYEDIAKEIFKWFHKKLMKKYDKEASIYDFLSNGNYNLISANAIFYLICQKFKIPISFISNPYYIKTRLKLENEIIDIDILDKKNGFNSNKDRNQFVNYLVKINIIDENEVKEKGIDEVFSDYFTDYKLIQPYELIGYIYYKKGSEFFQLSNYKSSTENFEKALIISPVNESYIINYKLSLYFLKDQYSNLYDFIQYFKNSLYLLSDDWSYSGFAIPVATQILYKITNDHRNYSKALNLILQFKTTYMINKFLYAMNNIEIEIEYDWILYLALKGNLDSAYIKVNKLYNLNRALPKYKDLYINITIDYCKSLITRNQKYELANSIMDSLIVEATEYPIINDAYVYIVLAPYQFEYRFAEKNTTKALELAHKVFKFDPNNRFSKKAISDAYHHYSMSYIRRNDLKRAHKILIKGLEYVPDDKLLNEDIEQLEDAF